jgi:hypothetical protein
MNHEVLGEITKKIATMLITKERTPQEGILVLLNSLLLISYAAELTPNNLIKICKDFFGSEEIKNRSKEAIEQLRIELTKGLEQQPQVKKNHLSVAKTGK